MALGLGRRAQAKKKVVKPPRAPRRRVARSRLSAWWRRWRTIGLGSERTFVMENISMLVASGMPVVETLAAIAEDVKAPRLRTILREVATQIESGATLWGALEDVHLFPSHVISLIRIGEESGKLAENLHVVVVQQEKERSFRAKVRSAMLYPVLVMVIAVVIAIGMAWFVLPRLVSVFSKLNVDLPLVTRLLVDLGQFLRQYGNIAVPGLIIVLLFIVFILFGWSRTRWIGQMLAFRVPGVRRLIREVELARMGYILGTLLDAGLPILQSLSSLRQTTTFYAYRNLFTHIRDKVDEGHSWKQALTQFRGSRALVPAPIQQMIIAGDTSGRLPATLLKIGEIYEAKTDTTAKNLTVILEPVMLVVVWAGVASVALAIIMPIYGLIGGLSTRQAAQSAPADVVQEAVVAASPTPSPTPPPTRLRISSEVSGVLNVRAEPTTTSDVVTELLPAEEYAYVDEEGEGAEQWYKIIIPGEVEDQEGWVFGEFVILLNEDGTIADPTDNDPAGDDADADEEDGTDDSSESEGVVEGSQVGPVSEITAEEYAGLEAALREELEQAVLYELQRRQTISP